MYDDDFGDYDDGLRFDEMECARGDYNVWEEEQVFQDGLAEKDSEMDGDLDFDPITEDRMDEAREVLHDDILARLEHFENYQLSVHDRYGAEVLHNAAEEIKSLRKQLQDRDR